MAVAPPPLLAAMAVVLTLAGCQRDPGPISEQQLVAGAVSCGAFTQPRSDQSTGRQPAPSARPAGAPDPLLVLAGSINQGILVLRTGSAEPLFHWNHRSDQHTIASACGFASGADLALTAADTELALWSTRDGRALRYWSVPAAVRDLAVSSSGRYALIGMASGEAGLFDIQHGGIKRLFAHDGAVVAVALSADDRLALTGSTDQMARLWDIESGKLLRQWNHQTEVTALAFSADGALVFTSARYDGGRVWERVGHPGGDQPLWQLPDRDSLLKRGHHHTAAMFVGGSDQLLVAGTGGHIEIWDWRQQRQLMQWRLPERQEQRAGPATVLGLAAAADGYRVLASDGYLYRLELPAPLSR